MTRIQKFINRIEINPKKLGGKPAIKGTRIAVEQVLRLLAAGILEKEILLDFPQLTHEDILAAVQYAAKLMEDFQVYPKDYLQQIELLPV